MPGFKTNTLFDLMYGDKKSNLLDDIVGYEDGGFVGFQYGGGLTAEQVLKKQGLDPTPEQLKLFADMDPTQIQNLARGLQENLLTGTQQSTQQQVQSGFGGFGAGQQAMSQMRQSAQEGLSRGIEQAQRDFTSQTLGTAADLVAGGAELGASPIGTSVLSSDYRAGQDAAAGVGAGTETTGDLSVSTIPPGWPSVNSYNAWVSAGSDPNNATSYGFSGPSFLLGASGGGYGG